MIQCKDAFGGAASDPATKGIGDTPGVAEVRGFTAYGCAGPVCELAGEPAEVGPLGQASNPVTKSKETVERITAPWEAVLNEPKEKEWKLKIGNKTSGSETQVRLSVSCPAKGIKPELRGALNAMGESGTMIGSAPAKLGFKGAESGELESGIGGVVLTGKLKLMGYEAEEVITVVNQ